MKIRLVGKMRFRLVGKMRAKLILSLICIVNVLPNVRLELLVQTKSGLVKGLEAKDGSYSMFLGIPYAKVDDNNPFGPAQPISKFNGTLYAMKESDVCPQSLRFLKIPIGTLDCLHLNIYVPKTTNSHEKFPVMVWIYGGSFTRGSGGRFVYGPKYLVRHGVILVTLNYRIGLYGFMCLGTPEVPGNQGIRDQVIALRWIKANIEAFGGDMNKITLSGESSGSASVEMHLISQQEKFFDKAILQSGSNLKPGRLMQVDTTLPLMVAKNLGFKTDNFTEALSFLKHTDIHSVVSASNNLGTKLTVCIEKKLNNVEPIITQHLLNIEMPKLKNTPILGGFNSREGLMMDADQDRDYFKNCHYFNDTLKLAFNYDENFKGMVDSVRHFYIGDEELTEAVRENIIDFEGDYFFGFPVQWSLKIYFERGAARVYQYLFSYEGKRNLIKDIQFITHPGASHADELGYLFDVSFFLLSPTYNDQLVIDRMTKMWTNFVKFGDPTPKVTKLLPVKWEPIGPSKLTYLNIDSNLTLSQRPFQERLSFWELFYKANMQRLKGYKEH